MPFHDLAARLADVRQRIAAAATRGQGQEVRIVAVTKTHGIDAVRAAWEAGIRDIGENRVQEALQKIDASDVPVAWHLIGHLQRNKVKSLDRFSLVHSIDTVRLADAVDQYGEARGRAVDALIQVNVSSEETKGGYAPKDIPAEAERLAGHSGIRVLGVMTMAPFGAEERVLREVFIGARRAREVMASAGHPATELSMGMSDDYEVAVEEGATMVRLGTVLFGRRPG
ncbi:MAG TPA: YggS family pyridoxal phosphate-dependent enzyme [Gemmatimonadaceae bacterium]|nr:YggS family pyridoxal phosphate-dependent enzyme [Gemmatimonadaceae bacterium]